MGLGPRSANPRLGGPFLADAAHDAITTPLAPPSEPALLGDAPPATPAPGPTLLDEQPPPAPGPTLLDDRVRPMQPPAPQPVWQQRADLHLGAAHQRPPGWPPVPQPRPADRHPIPAPRHGAGGGAERTIVIPAALLTVAVIAAAIVITSQQQQNSNRPQVTLPTGTQTPRTHIRSSSHADVHRPFPRGVAVDSAGNLYVTDSANNRVVTLAAGSNTQSVLPFDGLNGPTCSRYGRLAGTGISRSRCSGT